MALRANKFLKFFAIVLFMAEFIAPAFPLETYTCTKVSGTTQLTAIQSSIFLSLFNEQMTKDEEGKENFKNLLPILDYHFNFRKTSHSLLLKVSLYGVDYWNISSYPRNLYRLHCAYLI